MHALKDALNRAKHKSQDINLKISIGLEDDDKDEEMKDKEAGLAPEVKDVDAHEMAELKGLPVSEEKIVPQATESDEVGEALLAGEEANPMRNMGGLRDKVKHGIRMGKK